MNVTCDTSVIVPALAGWHRDHERCAAAIQAMHGVCAHALIETFSVLTRLPAPHRVSALDAAEVLEALSWEPLALPATRHISLIHDLGRLGISGGAAHDALIAATARHHGLLLLTRDRRAIRTYERLDVEHRAL